MPVRVASATRRNAGRAGSGLAAFCWGRSLTEVTGISRNCLLELTDMPPRRFSPTALSWSLRAGAAYDALFALLLAAFPRQIAAVFRLPLPGERFYLWLIAVFLLSLGVFYILVGAAVIGAAAVGRPDLGGLWAIAGGDLLFGAAHLALSRSLGADPASRA